ncbi:MAG: acyl carrier protein [Defluviitaleaceae bacterium]|nr:acyl carrier protein [Defluviitaleaceae bacterium]MCL2837257.1 acyl carrier protein [Defluviitaleaceae bacterium]
MIFEKIRELIAEQLGIEEDAISLETNFRTELKADSLDLFQIINDIEDEYDITIENVEEITTVAQAVKYVEANKK